MNSAAINATKSILRSAQAAEGCNAAFVSDSVFVSELLGVSTEPSFEEKALNGTLALDLPLISGASVSDLMQLRTSNTQAFANFRLELEKNFRSLKTIRDPIELRRAAANVQHELLSVQLPRIEQSFKSFWKGLPFKIFPAAVSFLGGLATGPSLLVGAVATAHLVSSWRDYRSKIKDNPAYFMWKLSKKSGPPAKADTITAKGPMRKKLERINFTQMEMVRYT